MKKICKYIIIIFLFIPFIIKAKMYNYENGIVSIDNYIESDKYYDRNKYLFFDKTLPLYEENNLLFINGGFLSLKEYNLSKINGKSYLSPGLEYWTLTSKDEESKYVIGTKTYSKQKTQSSSVRVTEYVKRGVSVTGKGTYTNPWIFKKSYMVQIKSSNIKYGTINNQEGIKAVVGEGDNFSFSIYPSFGYMFDSNSSEGCSIDSVEEDDYVISNIKKDIVCLIQFTSRIYTYNLDNENATTDSNPDKIYLKYSKGWYSDLSTTTKISKITIPTRVGYAFEGYYGMVDGVETQIIDKNGNIKSTTNILKMPTTNESEQTLVAHYKACGPGTYLDENVCKKCEIGYYSDEEINTSCTPCDIGFYQDEIGKSTCKACPSGKTTSDVGSTSSSSCSIDDCSNGGPGCISCEKGHYLKAGSTTCSTCAKGTYQDTEGSSTCKLCTKGTTSAAGSTSSSACTACSNKANVSTWKTPSYSPSSNTVTNLCVINTCNTGYELVNNKCVAKKLTINFYICNKTACYIKNFMVTKNRANTTFTYGDTTANNTIIFPLWAAKGNTIKGFARCNVTKRDDSSYIGKYVSDGKNVSTASIVSEYNYNHTGKFEVTNSIINNYGSAAGSTINFCAKLKETYARVYFGRINTTPETVLTYSRPKIPSDFKNPDGSVHKWAGQKLYYILKSKTLPNTTDKYETIYMKRCPNSDGSTCPANDSSHPDFTVFSAPIGYNNAISDHGNGLPNANSGNYFIKFTRSGYHIENDKAWKCIAGCSTKDKIFSQTKTNYSSTDFCNSEYNDCYVFLIPNWTKD